MANNGQILFKINLTNTINHPIIINESVLYVENTMLKSASRLTGKVEWEKNLNLNDMFRLVSHKHHIIAYNFDNKIICIDSRNGKILWKSNKEVKLKYSPVIQDNNLFVVDEGETDQILNYNIENGEINWFYNKPILDLKITSTPSINKELLVIQTKINSKSLKNDPMNNTMLFGIDINTGKLTWEKETLPISQRPIITENLIFYTTENNNIAVLDTLSGKEIPISFTSQYNEEMRLSQLNIYKDSIYSLLKSENSLILTANK